MLVSRCTMKEKYLFSYLGRYLKYYKQPTVKLRKSFDKEIKVGQWGRQSVIASF